MPDTPVASVEIPSQSGRPLSDVTTIERACLSPALTVSSNVYVPVCISSKADSDQVPFELNV